MISACSPSQIIRQSMLELKLQAEESFVLKVVQLEELLQVRHSVFVVGNAGCGKSQVAAKPSPRTQVPSCPWPSTSHGLPRPLGEDVAADLGRPRGPPTAPAAASG